MTGQDQPLVSVVTPVYNGDKYLAECIESVLSQTYQHYEYLIVNNCSKDRTLEIALSYAKKDSRVRVRDNETFLAVIANHNHAFRQMSPSAKYCKVVSGDDFISPDCLTQMVEFAEEHPSVGIVGSYQQSGKRVRWQGFQYPKAVMSGRDLCRQMFLRGDPDFGFGSPTSLLYRADLIRNTKEFYPDPSPHSDTSACFCALQDCDFGFIYQVISYERTHGETQTSRSQQLNRYASAYLNDLQRYGPAYLSETELQQAIAESLDEYHRFLAINYVRRSQGDDFWHYHRSRLDELGHPLKPFQLVKALMAMILREVRNPEQAIRKFSNRMLSNPSF
jgi:glycosyltransferase involved in cell wall biosynthesis